MTTMFTRWFALVAMSAIIVEVMVFAWPENSASASHGRYVVQPVYVYASDRANNYSLYASKVNQYMTEAKNWYSTAHLSTGDTLSVNNVTYREGARTMSDYCDGSLSTCDLGVIWPEIWSDLGNPSSSSYLGYDPATAKNVITLVFFDAPEARGGGLGEARGLRSHYNPEGYGGRAMFGEYVLYSDETDPGSPGHDGTIAHEIGHGLRIPHSPLGMFGDCSMSGKNLSHCWPNSTSLVNQQGSDGRYYYEEFATHYSPFTSPSGGPSPTRNHSASQVGCGSIQFTWTVLSGDSVTSQLLLLAPRGSKLATDGTAIRVDNIFLGINRQAISLGATTTSRTVSGLSPGWYHWEVSATNSSGFTHGWPDASGVYLSC